MFCFLKCPLSSLFFSCYTWVIHWVSKGEKKKLLCWMDEDFHFTFHLCTIASLWSNSFHEWSFVHLVCFIVNSYLRLCFIHVCLILLFQQANFFSFLFSHFPKFFSFSPCLSLSSSHFFLFPFILPFNFFFPLTYDNPFL